MKQQGLISNLPVRRVDWPEILSTDPQKAEALEWLVTNGIGGYASGTVSGVMSRRYHGLLISNLPAPLGRTLMFTHLSEQVRLPDNSVIKLFDTDLFAFGKPGPGYLSEFRMEGGLPVWRFEFKGYVLEKRILMPYDQNTVFIIYDLVEGGDILRLKLRPSMSFRHHEDPVNTHLYEPYELRNTDERFEFSGSHDLPPLRMALHGERTAFTIKKQKICEIMYRTEEHRGYECVGDLWTPGYFRVDISRGKGSALAASTEHWDAILSMNPADALASEYDRRERLLTASSYSTNGTVSELVLAADQFIITPVGRPEEASRARAAGDEVRTIIAGYHWFTDWGRDTMISLEGLTLVTGRRREAGYILRTFSHYIKDGLIPNMFPEGNKEGLYHTADATLWYFHAIDRYLEATGDFFTLQLLLPGLIDIIERHLNGTRFGIRADSDGLLTQGQQGYQLTWMDAKVGDWVVTPRRGKAVEINALWYNALSLMEKWVGREKGASASAVYAKLADNVKSAFNKRFWFEKGGYLYDVVDGENGDDPSCRPNQVFAISLPNPVLEASRWGQVLDIIERRLLTSYGLRSLAHGEPEYKSRYSGDIRARDAAYHQGTVWSWLIGPFIDAWLKLHPADSAKARTFLNGLIDHLGEAGLGTISEVFHAEEPFTPGGCIAQAWGVAEVLRSLVKTS